MPILGELSNGVSTKIGGAEYRFFPLGAHPLCCPSSRADSVIWIEDGLFRFIVITAQKIANKSKRENVVVVFCFQPGYCLLSKFSLGVNVVHCSQHHGAHKFCQSWKYAASSQGKIHFGEFTLAAHNASKKTIVWRCGKTAKRSARGLDGKARRIKPRTAEAVLKNGADCVGEESRQLH